MSLLQPTLREASYTLNPSPFGRGTSGRLRVRSTYPAPLLLREKGLGDVARFSKSGQFAKVTCSRLQVDSSGEKLLGYGGNSLTLWELKTGDRLREWKADIGIAHRPIELSPDGTLLAVYTID